MQGADYIAFHRFQRGLDARSYPAIRITGETGRDRNLLVGRAAEGLKRGVSGTPVAALFVDSAFGAPVVECLGAPDETLRLHEYSPGFEPERFAAHEKFFVEDVHRWTESRLAWRCPLNVLQCSRVESWPSLLGFGIHVSRCGLLRLARRRLRAAWRNAESASAHIPVKS
ncbi:MAG TPA: hypothetical protein VIY49_02475 [Bryobacteraceae bacterium]